MTRLPMPSSVTLLAVGGVLIASGCDPRSPADTPARMEVIQTTRDLLADLPELEVVEEHPERAPEVDVVTPAPLYSRDGADMLSLVMAPPCEVRFRLGVGDAPSRLRARAGVDVSVLRSLSPDFPAAEFRFEVLLDGAAVFDERITLAKGADPPGSDWADVGAGIELEPGQEVTLRTSAVGADGEPVAPPVPLAVGFGGLRLERSLSVARRRSSPAEPNVVLIVMDTLRRDRLSAYGYEPRTSPHLEALAARGALFDNAYASSSWTWPSTASILTGLHPQEHGVLGAASCYLEQDIVTVAEALQLSGISTAAWTGNPLLSVSRNFDQGFEVFRGSRHDFRKTGVFFDEVVAWIEERAGQRFFLYLQLTEPHHPFEALPAARAALAPDAPPEFHERMMEVKAALRNGAGVGANGEPALEAIVSPQERAWASDVYDACVRSGDHWLGELVAALERLGLEDETLVVFTSDHGEELFERGFFNHGQSVFAELVRAPLVMAGPGVPAGVRIAAPTSNRQLAPFFASLAGTTLQGLPDPVLFGELPRTVLYSTENGFWDHERGDTVYGLRSRNLALQYAPVHDAVRLFDLDLDPTETVDVAAERVAEVERLRSELLVRLKSIEPRPSAERRVGEETLRMLQDIGYLGEDE